MSAPSERVLEALAAYDRGWWLVALRGKVPVAKNWASAPRASRELVEQWAAHDNVGVRCLESGLIVIDDDTADHSAAGDLELPPTWTSITGSDHLHHIFDSDGHVVGNSTGKLGAKIDVRAARGQFVLAGSIHPVTGVQYRWALGLSPADLPLAKVPASIIERLAIPASDRERVGSHALPDAARVRRYAESALKHECDRVASTVEGARNDTLFRASAALGQLVGAGALTRIEAVAGLGEAARRCGLPDQEASRTIASGLKAGEAEPRDLSDFVSDRSPHPTILVLPRRRMIVPTVPAFAPFPTSSLPEPIGGAILAHANAIGCDPSMVALPMLACLAASVGNARRIRLRPTWAEPCIIWAAGVAPSGAVKSPPFDAALAPLRRIQNDAFRDYATAMDRYRVQMQCHAAALSDWRRITKRSPEPPLPPNEPKAWRILVSDPTVEALAPILRDNPRGLLLSRDELSGWFQGFDAYKQGRGGDAARWLEMHRAGSITIDRKTGDQRTIHVPRASLSIAGTIQPAILGRSLGFEHFQNGMAARLLFAMPPRTQRVWTDATVSADVEAAFARVVARLLALEMPNGEPIDVDLSPDGKAAYVEFFNLHGAEQFAMSGDLLAAWSKLEGYAARLALIVHLVRIAADDATAGDTIDDLDVLSAVRLVRWFSHEAQRVYSVLAETPEQAEARELTDLLSRNGGGMTARDLRRKNRRYTTTEAAAAALARLVEGGVADWIASPAGEQGGRPTRTCRLRDHIKGVDVDETSGDSSTPAADAGAEP